MLPNFFMYFLYASKYDLLSPISMNPDSIVNALTFFF